MVGGPNNNNGKKGACCGPWGRMECSGSNTGKCKDGHVSILKPPRGATNAPVIRRGIEGEQPAEPAPEAPTESAPAQPDPVDQSSETKSQ